MYYIVMTKNCIKCKQTFDCSLYHKDKRRSDGLYPYCKKCRREYYGVNELKHKKIGELDGYIIVDDSRYPCILTAGGRVRLHRYIVEKRIGRQIGSHEEVHHINGNKKDWSDENLILLTKKAHRSLEGHKTFGHSPKIACTTCGCEKTYSNYVFEKKVIVKERYQCSACYRRSGGPAGRKKALLENTT